MSNQKSDSVNRWHLLEKHSWQISMERQSLRLFSEGQEDEEEEEQQQQQQDEWQYEISS